MELVLSYTECEYLKGLVALEVALNKEEENRIKGRMSIWMKLSEYQKGLAMRGNKEELFSKKEGEAE